MEKYIQAVTKTEKGRKRDKEKKILSFLHWSRLWYSSNHDQRIIALRLTSLQPADPELQKKIFINWERESNSEKFTTKRIHVQHCDVICGYSNVNVFLFCKLICEYDGEIANRCSDNQRMDMS